MSFDLYFVVLTICTYNLQMSVIVVVVVVVCDIYILIERLFIQYL